MNISELCIRRPVMTTLVMASVLLAGARPARSVLRLEGPGVTVHGWVDDIRTAADVEAALWQTYELRFQAAHEFDLAVRYEPATDKSTVVVQNAGILIVGAGSSTCAPTTPPR